MAPFRCITRREIEMGFLGTAASSFADTVLIIQTIGFIVLLSGIIYVKRRDFLKHFRMTRITVF